MSLMRPTFGLLSSKLRLQEMAFPEGPRAPDSIASNMPENCSQQVEGKTSRHRRGLHKTIRHTRPLSSLGYCSDASQLEGPQRQGPLQPRRLQSPVHVICCSLTWLHPALCEVNLHVLVLPQCTTFLCPALREETRVCAVPQHFSLHCTLKVLTPACAYTSSYVCFPVLCVALIASLPAALWCLGCCALNSRLLTASCCH